MSTEDRLSSVWDQHLASECAAKSPEQALATMTAAPYVNVVALMIGARGRADVRDFYAKPFPVAHPAGHGDGSHLADHRAGPGRR
jgi:hypothetical protein